MQKRHVILGAYCMCGQGAMEALPIFLDEIAPSEGISIVRATTPVPWYCKRSEHRHSLRCNPPMWLRLSLQLLSVALVLLFGEIVPQALCKAHSLAIGAYTAPFSALLGKSMFRLRLLWSEPVHDNLTGSIVACDTAVRVIMFVLYPVAKPIALLLDLLLGSGAKPATYRHYDTIDRFEDGPADTSAEVLTTPAVEIVAGRP
eukprot:COSAG02_NODE_2073_length_9931_cov_12.650020_2_plen_202_part_00